MKLSSWCVRVLAVVLGCCGLVGSQAMGQVPCVGDCDGNGEVSINELIIGVNINLGNRPVEDCLKFDSNSDGTVAVNELIQAVRAALEGCDGGVPTATPEADTPTPGGPTATDTATEVPTATATPTDAPPTATPASDIENVAGASAAIANAVAAIPNLIGAVLAGVNATQSGAAVSGLPGVGAGAVDPCELGGDVTQTGQLPNLTLTFNQCKVSRSGGSVLFEGTLTVNLTMIFQLAGTATFDASITFYDDSDQVLTQTDADLTAAVKLFVQGGSGDPCAIDSPIGEVRITRVDLTNLMGSFDSVVAGEGVSSVSWMGTSVSIAVSALSMDCVPVGYTVTVNGDASIDREGPVPSGEAAQSGGVFGVMFDVNFEDFVVAVSGDGNMSQLDISGMLTSTCLGETVTLSTPQSLSFLLGTFCPTGGTLTVEDIGDIVYSPAGVTVAGESYTSCSDPALLACVE